MHSQKWQKVLQLPENGDLTGFIERKALPEVRRRLAAPPLADCSYNCLCHNVDEKRIAQLINPFADLSRWRYSVYVLECRPRPLTEITLNEIRGSVRKKQWVEEASKSSRLVYVGVAKRVNERLAEHTRLRSGGANFTEIFPPTRVLSITYYPRKSVAYRAEELTAEIVEEHTRPDIYVAQPG